MNPWLFPTLGLIVVVAPAVLTIAIGLPALLGFPLSERGVHRWTSFAIGTGLLAALGVLGLMLLTGDRNVEIELGNWVQIPEQHFHFHLKFVFDRLSTPMVMLTLLLCGVVGAFTGRYLHREAGYGRFYPFRYLYVAYRHGPGWHDRNAVLRLGAGRPVVGPADRLLPRTAGPRPQRTPRVVRVPHRRRRVSDRRRRHASSDRRRRFRGADGLRPLARGKSLLDVRAGPAGRPAADGRGDGEIGLIPFSAGCPGDGWPDAVDIYAIRSPRLLRISPILEQSSPCRQSW